MTDEDAEQSNAIVALSSQMQRYVVFQLTCDQATAGKGSVPLNVTAAVHAVNYPLWNFSVANITIIVFASLVIFCTLSGNSLVIIAVIRERRLRKLNNSFIINLAVSDVLVGLLVTPIALLYQLHGHWVFSRLVCDFWVSMDVTCCTASIANLCAISYDRYNAITRPLRYARRRTRRRAFYLIVAVWTYSLCIALPPFLGWGKADQGVDTKQCKISQHEVYTLYSTIGAFYLPLCFMLFAYICIYRETSKRTRQWRCGPGSSKIISERDCHRWGSSSIPMTPLLAEREPFSSSFPGPVTYGSGKADSLRASAGSGAFPRNSSAASRHVDRYDTVIVEVDESTRKERSSSNEYNVTNTTSLRLTRTPIHVDRARRATPIRITKMNNHLARRTWSRFHHKLIRQISAFPSSDSSTATSSSSAVTISSSELLPEQIPLEPRCSSLFLRQTAGDLCKDRTESSLTSRQNATGHEGNRLDPEDHLKSMTFRTSPSSRTPPISEEKTVLPATDSGVSAGQIAGCVQNGNTRGRHRWKMSATQEKRAAKTLSVVLGCFIICWLPFFVVALLKPLCGTCHIHSAVSSVVLWLGYCNSALNPIIYTFFNKDFRYAFNNILCCACHCYRRRRRRPASL